MVGYLPPPFVQLTTQPKKNGVPPGGGFDTRGGCTQPRGEKITNKSGFEEARSPGGLGSGHGQGLEKGGEMSWVG